MVGIITKFDKERRNDVDDDYIGPLALERIFKVIRLFEKKSSMPGVKVSTLVAGKVKVLRVMSKCDTVRYGVQWGTQVGNRQKWRNMR